MEILSMDSWLYFVTLQISEEGQWGNNGKQTSLGEQLKDQY